MTNLGPLTTAFAPAASASCATTIFVESNTVNWLQYGPISTDACLPPSFNPFAGHYYSPGICPSGYTIACSFQGDSGSVTEGQCCPTGYTCHTGVDRSGDPFGCTKPITQNTFISLTYYGYHESVVTNTGPDGSVDTTTMTSTTVSPTVVTRTANDVQIEAYGPIVRRSDGDPEWDNASGGSSSSVHSGSSSGSNTSGGAQSTETGQGSQEAGGLSGGAKAGIGIGVAVGVLLILGALFVAYRIRQRRQRRGMEDGTYKPQQPPPPQYAEMMDSMHHAELPDPHKTPELNAMGRPVEMRADGRHMAELA
ncbi:hypothetical protein GQ53DRAFT_147921 [Thozetella sp. PMI_491]|nr:hypothetical protein GQ53DRAFT_147921 [Thozetella sp. PMI_491]